MDFTTIIPILTTLGALAWGILTKWDLVDKVNIRDDRLKALADAARKEAIASDYYIRSMSDGKLTIEEGEQFKTYAADAIVSHLTLSEKILGVPIYNRTEVPLPLPVGGARISTLPEGIVADNIAPSDVLPSVINQVTINQVNPAEQSTNTETPGAVTV